MMKSFIGLNYWSCRDLPCQAMAQRADDLKGGIAENSGHFVPEEEPGFLAEQIVKFAHSSEHAKP